MWIAVIAATLISLIGYQSLLVEAAVPSSRDSAMAEWLSVDMAAYRSAVVAFSNEPGNANFSGTAPLASLHFPLGYVAPPVVVPPDELWTNQILKDGTIIIFANIAPPVPGVTSAINRMASSSPTLVQSDATSVAKATVTAPAASAAERATLNANLNAALDATTTGNAPDLSHLVKNMMLSQPAAVQHVPVWLAHRG